MGLRFKSCRVVIVFLALWLSFGILLHEAVLKTPTKEDMQEAGLLKTYTDLRRQQREILDAYAEISRLIENSTFFRNGSTQTMNKTSDLGQKINGSYKDYQGGLLSLEHEATRRKLELTSTELWYFLSSQLKTLSISSSEQKTKRGIEYILRSGSDYQRMLKRDFRHLKSELDDWRMKESQSLGDLIQRRLDFLQNPRSCSVRKLYCGRKTCGYGCQVHHFAYCLLSAYASKRMLVLEAGTFVKYKEHYNTLFQPLSRTCDTSGPVRLVGGSASELFSDVEVVNLGLIDGLKGFRDYLPLAIPKDIANRLRRFHGNPSAWWIAQFTKYLTRPQKSLEDRLKATRAVLGFKNPIVGVHIRRTDKRSEAAFHSVTEYMVHVAEWFDTYERSMPLSERRVFLATDDVTVLKEARDMYPNYTIVSSNATAGQSSPSKRYQDLWGVVKDIHLLSLCDHLVCTFSSQVCRLAYEQMQTLHGDASTWFTSLDDVYYYGGQNQHKVVAIETHEPSQSEEFQLVPGDIIDLAGNHWNGFSKGNGQRGSGLFPSYKVKEQVFEFDFPKYPEVSEDQKLSD